MSGKSEPAKIGFEVIKTILQFTKPSLTLAKISTDPEMKSIEIAYDNSSVKVIFNEKVEGTSSDKSFAKDAFHLEVPNPTQAISINILGVDGKEQEEITIRFSLQPQSGNTPYLPNGAEVLCVSPNEGKVKDVAGNFASHHQTQKRNLHDKTPPTILSITVGSDNNYIDITFSEAITDENGGILEFSDFNVLSVNSNISANGTAPAITDHPIPANTKRLGLTITSPYIPNGSESITINPAPSKIKDLAGNFASTNQAINSVNLVPQNQDLVFGTNKRYSNGTEDILINNGSLPNNQAITIWLAKNTADFNSPVSGEHTTTLWNHPGTQPNCISVPSQEGDYHLFLTCNDGRVSSASTAQLTVYKVPPTIASICRNSTINQLIILFNQDLDTATAESISNYRLDINSTETNPPSVSSATLATTGINALKQVTLVLSQNAGSVNGVNPNGVLDRAGNSYNRGNYSTIEDCPT